MDRSALRVTVVGVGAIGAAVLPLLRHRSVASVRLVDGDTIEEANLPRQLLYHAGDAGRLKVTVAVERIAVLNPGLTFHGVPRFLDGGSTDLLADTDVVLDCCDDLHAKRLIAAHCLQAGLHLISAAVHGQQLQVSTQAPGGRAFFAGRITDEQATCAMQQVPLPVIAVCAALIVQRLQHIADGDPVLAEVLDLLDVKEGRWMRIRRPQDPLEGELIALHHTPTPSA